jgi:2-polyprenyl-3-methyl-5-hydroxy-6-metoxy-1,4-benzoquinol methylase
MDRSVYDNMAKLDEQHWWYVARRDVLDRLIRRRIQLPKDARILEIGCGTGHNLPMLGQFGEVDAIEIDQAARDMASKRLGKPVMASPLPSLEGVADASYDMVAILDVLEHIEEDKAALTGIAAKLKPGGRILITVPAHPWMWSAHDVVNHHKRRYTRRTLRKVIAEAGLRLDMLRWFNSLLFPAAAGARLVGRLVGKEGGDDTLPSRPVNFLFGKIFALERHAIGRLPMTPGVSLAAIVSVPEEPEGR